MRFIFLGVINWMSLFQENGYAPESVDPILK